MKTNCTITMSDSQPTLRHKASRRTRADSQFAGRILLVLLASVSFGLADELSLTPSLFPQELSERRALALSSDKSTYVFGSGRTSAILWSARDGVRDISGPASWTGYKNAFVRFIAISNDGSAVLANYNVATSGGGSPFSFRWTQASGWVPLSFTATSMSEDGSVIVGYRENHIAFPGNSFPLEAVVSRSYGASPVPLPKASNVKVNGREVLVSGDGRVIAGFLAATYTDYDRCVLLRWDDDSLTPISPIIGVSPYLVSYDGSRIFLRSLRSSKIPVLVSGVDKPLLLSDLYYTNPPTFASHSGLLVSSDSGIVWDRGGRTRDLLEDASLLGVFPGNYYTRKIIRIEEDGDIAHAYLDTGEVLGFPNPNQGDPVPLTGGPMLEEAGRFKPSIKLTETFRQQLDRVRFDDPYIVTQKGTSRFSLVASIAGIDPTTLGPDTEVSLHVGDCQFSGRLSDDPKYAAGKKQASIASTAVLNGKKMTIAKLTWAWSKDKLTVTGTFADPEQFGFSHRRYVGWAGVVTGWLPVEVGFAGLSGSIDAVWFTGKSTDTYAKKTGINQLHRVREVTLAGSNSTPAQW